MNYGEIVKAAFWITLRNRILWFFGFFAGGTSAGANFNIPPGNFGTRLGASLDPLMLPAPHSEHTRELLEYWTELARNERW